MTYSQYTTLRECSEQADSCKVRESLALPVVESTTEPASALEVDSLLRANLLEKFSYGGL